MPKPLQIAGQSFGRLTAIEPSHRDAGGRLLWVFRCVCGNTKLALAKSVVRGLTRSCGCLYIDERTGRRRSPARKHGYSKTPMWRIWQSMIQRCTKAYSPAFKNYGGRGIKVCNRWLNNFETFLADMGERPAGLTLERKDNNGPYAPENCVWATRIEQMRNTRTTIRVTIDSETRSLSDWSRVLGLKVGSVSSAVRRGESPERALRRLAIRAHGLDMVRRMHEARLTIVSGKFDDSQQ